MRDDMPKPFAHASHGRWVIDTVPEYMIWRTWVVQVVSSTMGTVVGVVLMHWVGVV